MQTENVNKKNDEMKKKERQLARCMIYLLT